MSDDDLERHLAALDAMLAAGDLVRGDHMLAVTKARKAVERGKPLPALRGPSAEWRRRGEADAAARKAAKAERQTTGLARSEQRSRDAEASRLATRNAALVRRRLVLDDGLAAGRLTPEQHAEAVSRLDVIAASPLPPPPPKVKRRGFVTGALDDLLGD